MSDETPAARSSLPPRPRLWLEGLLFVLVVSVWAHLSYSWLGYNPSDEGYMLSGSRRLLDGQVPHRDYLSLRPVGTHALHAHLLLWAGDRLIWWSRFVSWIQFALTAWLWVVLVHRTFDAFRSPALRLGVGFVAFAASAHSFPIMPWNSVDGLFFITVGLWVFLEADPRWRPAGLVLIGSAALFRQTFALVSPLFLLVLGQILSPRAWLATAAPGVLYNLFLLVTGALTDGVVQMTSHASGTGRVWTEVFDYRWAMARGVVLVALYAGVASRLAGTPGRWAALGCILGAAALALRAAGLPLLEPPVLGGYFFFGLAAGTLPFLARSDRPKLRVALLATVAACAVTLSEGLPKPTLAAGALFLVFAAFVLDTEWRLSPAVTGRSAPAVLALACLGCLVVFHAKRVGMVYYDRPGHQLKHELGDVFRGARGIYSNENTHGFLRDLTGSVEWVKKNRPGKRYSVIPECPQFWAVSDQPNPLSSDWPIDPEINHPAVRARLTGEIDRGKGSVVFVVQKYVAFSLREKPAWSSTVVSDKVRREFSKVHELPFFEIYE
ncbi:MAG: hypothetical protein HY815_00200 [Candidatus Riflebacteria bacterium]|nr:hypothetical protein [Candidatus Riflebacteria bacterium]